MKTVRILLTSVIFDKQQEASTKECFESISSDKYILDIHLDSRVHKLAVAEKWNEFFDWWRGKEYDYLVVMANDTLARAESIDYLVQCLEDNPRVGLLNGRMNRDRIAFLNKKIGYSSKVEYGIKGDTSNFIVRKGLIETIGRIDDWFPYEYVERDYLYRCELAGSAYGVEGMAPACTEMELFWHPTSSGTRQNRRGLQEPRIRYCKKWGDLDLIENFKHPFNDDDFDFTYCHGAEDNDSNFDITTTL